ncbi:CCA tRNA nucleotidyltransferase [Heyndrickxia acidiproducens]|uniref:CCA tRNA nucleotidyltransferase n=1 Tax=Heyndrickxia acidiproducens TaxID=1121084 RepID=UPI00036CE10B|nr:CCA tRNA nucleotidyltransferase [Heyndrickxia acidiproducens]
MLPPFQTALPILKTLEDAGFEAFFVGGAIRDMLLERPIHDVDIATSAKPLEVKALFPHTIDIGIEHGTVLVLYKGGQYEVTTFRTESEYKDYRRPESVWYVDSLLEDLKRRDFTMNAIAMDDAGKLVDPFSGCDAIRNKTIQTVGSPEERFHEDALRMMRAIRFTSQLGFTIEAETKRAISLHAPLLQYIAAERITQEFIRLLEGPYPYEALKLLCETKLLSYLPGLNGAETRLEAKLHPDLNRLTEKQLWLYLLAVCGLGNKEAFLHQWRLPASKRKEILRTFGFLQKRLQAEWDLAALYDAGETAATDAETVFWALRQEKWEPRVQTMKEEFLKMKITERSELSVTGTDLMLWFGKSGGPWIKEMLRESEMAVLNGEIANDREAIRRWLMCKHQRETEF